MYYANISIYAMSKGSLYTSNKPPFVSEQHAFLLTEFVGLSTHLIFVGSGGIMSTARLGLPYPCIFQAKFLVGSLEGGSTL